LWNQVVLENQSLARSVAGRYRNRGLELEDLTQVAMVGLVKAVHRYQVDRGWSFAAFALPTISGEIKRSFRDVGWMIRPPRRIQELQADLRTAQEHLGHLLRRAPNAAELATALQVDSRELGEALRAGEQFTVLSLDATLAGAEEPTTWGERVSDARDRVAESDTVLFLQPALERLDERERLILRLRFVEGATQAQIGAVIGVSQMQVSRLLNHIYASLRRELTQDIAGSGALECVGVDPVDLRPAV